MKNLIVISLALIISQSAFAQNKVCFTIDDLPTVGARNHEESRYITDNLIAHFQTYSIPAIGFVNERKLRQDGVVMEERIGLLESWVASGYELGNHTYSHMNFHENSMEDYGEDILKGEIETKKLMSKYSMDIRYFRHPYLRIGESAEKYDSLNSFLDQNNYLEAPVTIDNADYLFAAAYAKAMREKNDSQMQEIGKDYISYMREKIKFFERNSEDLFGRNIAHVLLLHANFLNADYLDELAEMYINEGYSFEPLEEVLKDPAYNEEISDFGPWGISWVHRWALSRGVEGSFFKGDPLPPDYINDYLEAN